MFSTDQIDLIRQRLAEDVIPEQISQEIGIPYSTFRVRLNQSGYRVKSIRLLETITPVGNHAEETEVKA